MSELERKSRKKIDKQDLAQRIKEGIGQIEIDATRDSFLIEHPEVSPKPVEEILWKNKRRKKGTTRKGKAEDK